MKVDILSNVKYALDVCMYYVQYNTILNNLNCIKTYTEMNFNYFGFNVNSMFRMP
jgi:hypothetical protein